jgi:hypothetical protein
MESIDTLLTRTADGLQDTSEVGTKQQKRKRKKTEGINKRIFCASRICEVKRAQKM